MLHLAEDTTAIGTECVVEVKSAVAWFPRARPLAACYSAGVWPRVSSVGLLPLVPEHLRTRPCLLSRGDVGESVFVSLSSRSRWNIHSNLGG